MATDAPTQPPAEPNPDNAPGTTSPTTQPSAPASPPLPARPVPLAPGPRAARLQEVYADRLRHTLARLSYANVAACYPTIAARSAATLRSMQGQMVSLLESRGRREFEQVLEGRDVVRKLNELEGLVAEAGRRRGEGEMDGVGAPVP